MAHRPVHLSPLRRLLVVCALVAVAAVAAPVPASADVFDDVTGPGSGNTGGGPDEYRRGSIICRNGEGWKVDEKGALIERVWAYPYSQCVPGICTGATWNCTWLRTISSNPNPIDFCPTHVEVWRFYGTRANPVKAFTVSRVNLRSWCEKLSSVRLFSPHPNDANALESPGPSNPFQGSSMRNVQGERVVFSPATSFEPFGVHTTDIPFKRAGSCTTLFSSDSPYAANTEAARRLLSDMYNGWTSRYTTLTARAMTNISSTSPIVWNDGIPCSSGTEFARPDSVRTTDPSALPVYGACWIGVERIGYKFTGTTPPNVVLNFSEYSIHRYDASQYPRHYTESTDLTDGGKPAYHKAWRDAIYFEVATRTLPGVPAVAGSNQFAPGEPYIKSGTLGSANQQSRVINRAAAANAAANFSRCEDGPLLSWAPGTTDPDPTDDPTPDPTPETPSNTPPSGGDPRVSVILSLTAPQNYIVNHPDAAKQEVRVTASNFQCTDCYDPRVPSPRIKDLTVNIEVATTGGYTQWKVAQAQRRNLMSVCSTATLRTSSCSTAKVLEFYRATNAGQSVITRVSGSGTALVHFNARIVQVPRNSSCDKTRPGCLVPRLVYDSAERAISIGYGLREVRSPVRSSSAVWRQ